MPSSGIADFFATVAGRNGIRENARDETSEKLNRAALLAAQRLREENQNAYRGKLEAASRAAYGSGNENFADLASIAALADTGTFESATGASSNVSDFLAKQKAMQLMSQGDSAGANSILATIKGAPLPVVKQSGGVMFNPYDPGVAPELTGPGAAMVAARTASAGSRTASADASRARADLTRRTDPNKPRGGKSSTKPASSVKPPLPDAKQAKDGKWYAPDPARPGKWLLVE